MSIAFDAAIAAAEEFLFLPELVLVFAVGAILTYLCHRLRLVPIVGFLVAGVLIGPHALGFVQSEDLIAGMAEVGVILLLFTIGVEFSLKKLALIRRFIVLGGGLQVAGTVLATALLLMPFGLAWRPALYTGCLVALSSTVIVLKLFSSAGMTDTPVGRIGLGVLIFQDLAVIGMVLLVPVLAGGGDRPAALALALAQALAIILLVLVLAYRAVPALLDRVAAIHNPELFLLTVVVVCFGIAWLTSLGGVSLSLGAFLAGLAVSGSRFREHAVGEILPLRTLFNAVFFVSVGMLLDIGFIVERPLLVAAVGTAVLVGKAVITGLSVLALRYPLRIAIGVALALAQIGEFSFVLEGVGRAEGLSPGDLGETGRQTFLAVTVLLMVATPFVMRLEPRLRRRAEGWAGRRDRDRVTDVDDSTVLKDHVILCGYGLAGRVIQNSLQQLSVRHVVVDLNPVSVLEAEAAGIPAVYGDLTRASVLEEVHAHDARLVVVAINDAQATARIVQRLKLEHPGVEVVARVPYVVDAEPLEVIGAEVVVVEEIESTVHLLEEALHGAGIPHEEVVLQVDRFRARMETE